MRRGFLCAPHPKPQNQCNSSAAFHGLAWLLSIKCEKDKMEKQRHSTLRSICGVAFKLNFRQSKPTTLQSMKKRKAENGEMQMYKNPWENKRDGEV